jgi:hypothetical protein
MARMMALLNIWCIYHQFHYRDGIGFSLTIDFSAPFSNHQHAKQILPHANEGKRHFNVLGISRRAIVAAFSLAIFSRDIFTKFMAC